MSEAGNREKGRAYFALIVLALLTGCSDPVEGFACTGVIVFGVTIEVVDDVTGETLAAEGTSGRLIEGSYQEDMEHHGTGRTVLAGAAERAGVYSVSVFNPMYRTWVASNVVVLDLGCHVEEVKLTARMVRVDGYRRQPPPRPILLRSPHLARRERYVLACVAPVLRSRPAS